MSDFDFALLQELAEQAPSAGYANVNYGRLSTEVNKVWWTGSKKEGNSEKHGEAYNGKPLNKGERIQFVFSVNIQEFNPALTFNYSRKVEMVKSQGKTKTDWSETVLPSLIATFGDGWAKEIGKSLYVAVEDVPQVDGNEKYSTIRFLKKFKNKKECEADRNERFGKNENSNGSSLPAEVVGQVKAMLSTNAEEVVRNIIAQAPAAFGNADVDELILEARK